VPIRPEEAVARNVVEGYLHIRPGDRVTIETWTHGIPLARDLVCASRRKGGATMLLVEDEEAFFRGLAAPHAAACTVRPTTAVRLSDAYIRLGGPEAFPRLFGLPRSDRERWTDRPGGPWWAAARRSGVRGAELALAGATATAAATYRVDLNSWRRELLRASAIPPARLSRPIGRILRALARAQTVRVRHPNGTDLRLSLSPGRAWGEDGRVGRARRFTDRFWVEAPTGFVGAEARPGRTEGNWEGNRPMYDRFDRPSVAQGARFSFVDGRLSEFSFDQGGEAFAAAYARGRRDGATVAGLLFGVNPAIVRAPEVTERAVGAVSVVLGDNRRWGGGRRAPYSLVSTIVGAEVELDGREFRIDGAASA
jgi:hypothetical protein